MNYLRSYRFVFDSPKWVTNLLFATLCQLIPVVGPIALMGYLCEVLDALHAGNDGVYPDFEFPRFLDYLKRGLWPFLAGLVAGLIVVPIVGLFSVPMIAGMATRNETLTVIGGILYVLAILVLSLGLDLLVLPVTLRAAVLRRFEGVFSWAFIRDFAGRMWKEVLIKQIFLIVSSLVVVMAGLLLLCIGVYPAATLVVFAQWHLMYQTYRLYLQRGGAPIAAGPAPG